MDPGPAQSFGFAGRKDAAALSAGVQGGLCDGGCAVSVAVGFDHRRQPDRLGSAAALSERARVVRNRRQIDLYPAGRVDSVLIDGGGLWTAGLSEGESG